MKSELEVTVTRYNLTAVIGWAGIALGLVGAAVQYFYPSGLGFVFLAIGLIGGGITVSLAGPVRWVQVRKLPLR